VPVTRRAVVFSTHCSLSVMYLGDPAGALAVGNDVKQKK